MREFVKAYCAAVGFAGVVVAPVSAQESLTLPTIEVVGNTPLPGSDIDRDKVPSNVATVPASDFDHTLAPNLTDAMLDGQIQLVINTPLGKVGQADDAYIRQTAIKRKVSYITTLAAAVAAAKGIAADRQGHGQVKSLQSYHADIK